MGSAISVIGKTQQFLQPNLEMTSESKELCLDENNGFFFKKTFIPEEIVSIVLSYLDYKTLLQSRLVCHSWKIIIDTMALKTKAKRMDSRSLETLNQTDVSQLPWYVLYAICKKDPFNVNLLLNGCGQDNLKYWRILANGGNRWTVENVPQGCDPLPEEEIEFESHKSCFATSYSECKKQQMIFLKKRGLTAKIMDEIQPDIEVSEWYSGRFDCGCHYELTVTLLNDKKEPITDLEFHYQGVVQQWEGRTWQKVSHVFNNYGPGVRYVCFNHRGKDTQFWDGHYGSKMSGGKVLVKLRQQTVTFEK